MNRFSRPFAAVAFATTLVMGATPAWAASHKNGGGGGGTTTSTGIDVSYPQCPGTSLPAGEAFAIVSVTGGLANDYNSCLNAEFTYAEQSSGAAANQAPVQLYVNTADPGNLVADWPSPAQLGAYGTATTPNNGTCAYQSGNAGPGANSTACAYIYGYDMVAGITYVNSNGGTSQIIGDLTDFQNVTHSNMYQYPVWLDVETTNSWQSSTSSNGLAMNVADLQGMVDAFEAAATHAGSTAQAGIYSTGYQWNQITGTPTGSAAAGNLWGLPDWVPGARRESGAVSNCSSTPFTGGKVTITQWTSSYDYDYSCP